MNELLASNPGLLNNFKRRYSKTPGRLRMKNENDDICYTKFINLISNKNKTSRQSKIDNSLKKIKQTPL